MKAGDKLSNQLAGNFGLITEQKGIGEVDFSSHWLAVGTRSPSEPMGDKYRI
jgi:hypothetical protein